ncbi:MAG: hypothetical protein HQL49_09130 [Gammaproteobacteria bacterium]|nr:hypothetical protein [Gammaproteobacteria bacterium]
MPLSLPDLLIAISLGITITLFLWKTIEEEWPTPPTLFRHDRPAHREWFLHHDEKLLIPDMLVFSRPRSNWHRLSDYQPYPVSPAFGILYPALVAIAVRLLGQNNRGLRVINLPLLFLSLLAISATALHSFSGAGGIAFALILTCNVPLWYIGRHTILENSLMTWLLLLTALYMLVPQLLLAWIYPIAILTSTFSLIKITFPLYLHLYLFILIAAIEPELSTLFPLLLIMAGSWFAWEALHFILLYRLGVHQARLNNLYLAVKQHKGGTTRQPRHYQPLGSTIFLAFIEDLQRFIFTRAKALNHRNSAIFIITLGLILLANTLIPMQPNSGTLPPFIFLLLFLLLAMPLFYYLKRGYPLIPLFYLLICQVLGELITASPTLVAQIITLLLITITPWYLLKQWQLLQQLRANRTHEVAENSQKLGNLIGHETTIYAHAFALRFFWQAPLHFISGDDQFYGNQDILQRAQKMCAQWLLLAGRGGVIPSIELDPYYAIASFSTSANVSDSSDQYLLFKRRITPQDRVTHNNPTQQLCNWYQRQGGRGTIALAPANEATCYLYNLLTQAQLPLAGVFDRQPEKRSSLTLNGYAALSALQPAIIIIISPLHYQPIKQQLLSLGVANQTIFNGSDPTFPLHFYLVDLIHLWQAELSCKEAKPTW